MNANFAPSLGHVLQHEGGYADNPHDPGGATNRGVTQAVYDDWRASQGLPAQSVAKIVSLEVSAIYHLLYWDPTKGDELPSGVDYCTFDLAVNSGVNRASRFLQRVAGVDQDGKIGPVTIAAVKAMPPATVIDRLCDERADFLKTLGTFNVFGKGWLNRVADVRAQAKAMAL